MKLVPAFIKRLHNLPWQGELAQEDYFRLSLQFTMAMLIIFVVGMLTFGILTLGAGVVAFVVTPISKGFVKALLIGLLALAALVWFAWVILVGLKMEILRVRNLGFTTKQAIIIVVGMQVLMLVPTVFLFTQIDLSVFTTKEELVMPYSMRYANLVCIVYALYQYLLYFEKVPLIPRAKGKKKTATLHPLPQAVGAWENRALFCFQIYIWYTILSAPLNVIFPN